MIRNLGLALLAILLALAICEGLLRLFGSDVLPKPDLYVMDPDVGKRMRPGWEGDEFTEDELTTVRQWLLSYTLTIAGGSSEVQLNIVAKRVLGLPGN